MQRALAISLILFFGIGPLAGTLDAGDDVRLPPCCRRHGAHHCAMSDALMARMVEAPSSPPFFSAPTHCPFFPTGSSAIPASIHALAPTAASLFASLEEPHVRFAYRAKTSLGQIRTHAGRGPPRKSIA
ncbi:MAG TPA: hypothetical protein VFE01_11745 [Terracidiphilus sp.]|nr:hypothetical protein [Terracidiphilus sp.]